MGGIGLGLALMYFVAIGLTFVSGWEDWSEYFVPRALYFLLLPYTCLIVHVVLRNHVGRSLLKSGAYEEAVEYSQRRIKASLVRGKRESANQRLVCARGLVGLGDYEQARELLADQHKKLPGSYAMEARRWLFELALRDDDREAAQKLVVDDPKSEKSARGELVAILACEAELALRNGEIDRYRDTIEAAMWKKARHPRTLLCRAVAMVEFEDAEDKADEILDLLELAQASNEREIPARRGELTALRALVIARCGRREEAARLLDLARREPGDHWSKTVIAEVAEEID